MNRYCFALLGLLISAVAGCVQDPLLTGPEIPAPSAKGVYILNEGLFGRGNASMSYYDLESFRVYNNVFSTVNNKSLGDVGNSIVIRGNLGYIVVNNSHKIEVIDINTNVNVGTIFVGAGRSPRQLAFLDDNRALVTNLYDASVLLIDLKT